MNAIEIQSLKKTYHGGEEALKGIDLNIPKGSFFGLLGPNGAGKTTTIGILTGLINKSSGMTKIMNYDTIRDFKITRKLIGLSPQEINLDVFFSIKEILTFHAGYYGIKKKIAKENTNLVLNKLGLYHKRNSKARELSGGMKRRVQIAKALVHDPPILILDEPTAGVDIELRHMLWNYLKEINKEGKTILLTTHYIEEAEKLCDNIAIINKGKIITCGSTTNIIKEKSNNIIEIKLESLDNIDFNLDYDFKLDHSSSSIIIKSKTVHKDINFIINYFKDKSKIIDVKVINGSLEDAFLKLTADKNE